MFGILYFAYSAIMSGIAHISGKVRDITTMVDTYDSSTGLSYDSKSRYYDATMGNQQVVFVSHNNGRAYTRDLKTYKVLRDLTQEKMDAELQYYKNHPDPNHTVVRWSTSEDEPNCNAAIERNVPHGIRYKDIKTGKIYVTRTFKKDGAYYADKFNKMKLPRNEKEKKECMELYNKASEYPTSRFYMDIDTGMLVRVMDGTYDESRMAMRKIGVYDEQKIEERIEKKKEIDNAWIVRFNKEQEENIKQGLKEIDGYKFYRNGNYV